MLKQLENIRKDLEVTRAFWIIRKKMLNRIKVDDKYRKSANSRHVINVSALIITGI